MAEKAHEAADPEGSRGRARGGRSGGAPRQGARGGRSEGRRGGAVGADGVADGERSTSGAGGDEQHHLCNIEVHNREEPPLSKKSRKEQKRKKLEKRKRVEEDSRPRETVKTNKVLDELKKSTRWCELHVADYCSFHYRRVRPCFR